MPDFKYNIGLGRAREYHDRVANNDPTNSALVLVAIKATGVEATVDGVLQDLDDLAAVLANGNVDEFDGTGYARIVLTDADLTASSPDDANDRVDLDFADQTWTSVSADGSITDITDILVCYDSDTTGGTDANIIPVGQYDYVVTPNGGNITVQLAADGYWRVS